ncbi:MAG: fibronectin type III domain-containing protein, partial [Bacteroidales bacterium]|nr:fibronectin type III domain-containing protein [Bacteroidales bacterium]
MNKYIFPIMAAFAAILTACVPEDLPKADYNRAQVKDFVAIPGDREVTLSWSSYDNFAPDSYYVTWGNDADTTLTDTTLVVKELENGTKYTFTIQADYDDYGLSGQVSLECTPVTSRIAISDVVATTGDGTVHFEWSKPADNVAGYTLTWSLAGETAGSVDIAGSETSVAINDLTNYKNYTFVFVAHYPNGDSDDTSIKAMPSPGRLYTVNTTNPGLGAEVNLNIDEGVPDGNVVWNFDDGTKMAGRSVCHRFMTSGNHKVTLVVTFSDSDEIDVEIEFVVRDTYFYNEDYQIATGSYNGLKAQAPVFSPDGKTVYAATFNSPAGLYAFDIMTSTLKWSYICQSQGGAYGCSPVVDPNSGVIYFGTSTSGEFYALNPDGTLRWSNSQMKSVNKSYPAIGSDGTVYVMDSGNTLYALSPNDGSVKWSMELSDAGGNGGILVN